VDMKNYCKKVALSGESISIEAELPMVNHQLRKQLRADAAGAIDGGDIPLDDGDYDDPDSSEEGGDAVMNLESEGEHLPAGLVKVEVQIFTQGEANSIDLNVGLGRSEPNRLPSLTYPKTGRSWQAVLPSAVVIIENIIESYQGGKKRAKIVSTILFCIGIVVLLHLIPGQGGCPIIQVSCRSNCDCCQKCHNPLKADSLFCYYAMYPGYPNLCSEGTKNTVCRCVTKGDCRSFGPVNPLTQQYLGTGCNYLVPGTR